MMMMIMMMMTVTIDDDADGGGDGSVDADVDGAVIVAAVPVAGGIVGPKSLLLWQTTCLTTGLG